MKGVNNFYNIIFSGCNIGVVKQSSTNAHFFNLQKSNCNI